MQSGFTGGDVPDVYSTSRAIGTAMANHHPSSQQNPYRSLLPGGSNFIGPTSQMSRQIPPTSSTVIGKRSLADFRTQYQHNQALSNLLLRSVKPRTYNHQPSPVSHLSHIDFSSTMSFPISSELQSHRLLQQLRPHPMSTPMTNSGLPGLPYSGPVQTRSVSAHESETKMMNHRLQELEKQLLDDNDEDDAADEVSVITNTNSEWSETIQNLISPTQCQSQSQKSISPSPTSSTLSSSSSSSSVGSQASLCWKQSVMEAASVIYEGKSEQATEILMRVSCQIPNVKVHSEQRLMEFMISALKSRLNAMENPPPVAELYDLEHTASTQLLYEVSPCFKLSFLAANLAILEAVAVQGEESNCSKFHVLDFDIGQGGQYLNLLHMLSTQRQSGTKPQAAVFKLTTMAENGGEERLKKAGEMLSQHAERVGVSFKLNVMSPVQVSDLNRDSLDCEPDEPLAVNFAFKLYRMPDESVSTENPRDELLRRVKGLSPRVVTVVEQEMNTNTAPFPNRVAETSAYYGSLLDSIESTVGRENSDRVKVEEGLGRKLVNSVACEGRDRVERCEVFGKWRARLGMAGFELKPLSQTVAESMRTRLSTGSRVNPGFTVKEDNGGVCFGWLGRTLTVASAWR